MMCLADETQISSAIFCAYNVFNTSLAAFRKVPFGRYALRAIPPTSWAPPVHTPRAVSRPRRHISPERYVR